MWKWQAVVVTAALVLAACGDGRGNTTGTTGSPQTTTPTVVVKASVLVVEAPAPSTELRLEVRADLCAGGVPITLERTDVTETPQEVVVAAYVRAGATAAPGSACPPMFLPATVRLTEPVGARTVMDGSCEPPVPAPHVNENRARCEARPGPAADLVVGRWQAVEPGPLATRGSPKGVWTGREIIVVGGLLIDQFQAISDAAAYDPATGAWRRLASPPVPARIFHAVWTGEELVTFGSEGITSQEIKVVAALDPERNQWRTVALPPSTSPVTGAFWTGRQVLLWQAAASPPGALWDPLTNRWTPVAPNSVEGALSVGKAVWLGKDVAVEGSLTPAGGGPAEQRMFLYRPDARSWRVVSPLPGELGNWPFTHMAWTGREVVLVSSSGQAGSFAFDPGTDSWRTISDPDLSVGSGLFQAVSLADGRLVARVGNPAAMLQVLDPATGQWSPSGPPPGPVPDPNGVLVSTGAAVLHWGIAVVNGAIQPRAPNASWLWTP